MVIRVETINGGALSEDKDNPKTIVDHVEISNTDKQGEPWKIALSIFREAE